MLEFHVAIPTCGVDYLAQVVENSETIKPLRGRFKVALIHDLADGELSREQLGEKHGRSRQGAAYSRDVTRLRLPKSVRQRLMDWPMNLPGCWGADWGPKLAELMQIYGDVQEDRTQVSPVPPVLNTTT